MKESKKKRVKKKLKKHLKTVTSNKPLRHFLGSFFKGVAFIGGIIVTSGLLLKYAKKRNITVSKVVLDDIQRHTNSQTGKVQIEDLTRRSQSTVNKIVKDDINIDTYIYEENKI